MVLHPGKRAIRALGIAESFHPKAEKSTLAGVVVRTDLVVDGFVLGAATVGGVPVVPLKGLKDFLSTLNRFDEELSFIGS